MYHKVVKLVSTTKNDNPDVLFVLLTKVRIKRCKPEHKK